MTPVADKRKKTGTPKIAAWFVFVGVLAIGSRAYMKHARADRCSLDGNRITPIYQVDLVVDGNVVESFCCVKCAEEWPDVPDGALWHVRDEVTGQTIDTTKARFVESDVVTTASRQCRTHAFKNWADAMSHLENHNGSWVPSPFGRKNP